MQCKITPTRANARANEGERVTLTEEYGYKVSLER